MGQTVERRAARVLLIDDADQLLLLHGRDPADDSAGHWWFTPRRGLDGDESDEQAASRELAEETGLRVPPEALGAVVHRRVAHFRFAGSDYRQSEVFFLLRVPGHVVDTAGFTAVERASVTGHRWWTFAELAQPVERVYPVDLAEVVARALRPTRGAAA